MALANACQGTLVIIVNCIALTLENAVQAILIAHQLDTPVNYKIMLVLDTVQFDWMMQRYLIS